MILYSQNFTEHENLELDLTPLDLRQDMEKTRQALAAAYAGFNNATDFDMIDSYIYEINALQQRYNHLSGIAEKETSGIQRPSDQKSPIRSWIARIFR